MTRSAGSNRVKISQAFLGLVAALLAASVRKSPAKLIEQTAKRAEERPGCVSVMN